MVIGLLIAALCLLAAPLLRAFYHEPKTDEQPLLMRERSMSSSDARTPRLSIGLPVYNGERYLPQAISCLLEQTFGDFELIVCDNASSDGTQQIGLDFARRDARIRYVRNECNLGAVANFNRTVALGRAPYFKWAAHDDIYAPSYLARCTDILDGNPEVVLAHSDCAFIGEQGEIFAWDTEQCVYIDPLTGVRQRPDNPNIGDAPKPTDRLWQVLSGARWATHMFGVIRRPILKQTNLLSNFVSSDRALLAELALLGRFQACGERLFSKRFHGQSSWALNQCELRSFLSTADKRYSRRARQLQAFFAAPANKPIGTVEKAVCTGMVALHCLKVFGQALTMKDARTAVQGRVWRQKDQIPT
jgi:glycosyltransferase involved in cell wall biosynthesis